MALHGSILQTFLVGVVVSLLLTTANSQTVTVYPSFVGALRGEQNISLHCNATGMPSTPPQAYIEWSYFPSWQPTGFTIYSTIDKINVDPSNFTVHEMAPVGDAQSVDLVIKTAKAELATSYKCELSPLTAKEQSAYLIVLDDLECPASNIEYVEGDEANLTCGVNVFDYLPTNFPTLRWFKSGNPYQISGGVTTFHSNTRITHSIAKNVTSADDNQEFTCILDYPNSIPEYTDNCSVVAFVKHTVSLVYFYPPSSAEYPVEVAVGQSINCTTNGRPAPTVAWVDDQWNVLAETSELFVTEDMYYWAQPVTLFCKANNTIDNGVTFAEVTGNYTFKVIPSTEPVVQSAGTEAWVIAVAVICSILALAAIGVAIFFIVRHHKKKKQMKAKTTNGSTSARPTVTTTTTYAPVPIADLTNISRPPPTSAPRTTGSISSNQGPPGPDSRNGAGRVGDSPGFGDLGVQTYGGSTQAVNAYPTRSSLHGSNPALGVGGGVSMIPNPGYMSRGSNPTLNTSITTNPRPNYPYTGSNSALNNSLSMNPNPAAAAAAVASSYGRQPSIASSSGRSHASSYNATIPAMEMNRYPPDLASMHGSEV